MAALAAHVRPQQVYSRYILERNRRRSSGLPHIFQPVWAGPAGLLVFSQRATRPTTNKMCVSSASPTFNTDHHGNAIEISSERSPSHKWESQAAHVFILVWNLKPRFETCVWPLFALVVLSVCVDAHQKNISSCWNKNAFFPIAEQQFQSLPSLAVPYLSLV